MKFGLITFFSAIIAISCSTGTRDSPNTEVSIKGEKFYINGKPTFEGRTWEGVSVEGLLP